MKYIFVVMVFIFLGCSETKDDVEDLNYTVPTAIDSKNSPPTPPSLE